MVSLNYRTSIGHPGCLYLHLARRCYTSGTTLVSSW